MNQYAQIKTEGNHNNLGALSGASDPKNSPKSSISISISQWNARSVQSEEKINYLRSLPTDILAIQEVWQRQYNLPQIGRVMDISDRAYKRGGGTASMCMSTINLQVLKKQPINKDTSAIKLRIQSQYMWLINTYNYQGTTSKIQRLFGKIRKLIPINEWKIICIIGDFNVDINKISFESKLIKSLSKQMGLIIHTPRESTRGLATIDYMITGSKFILENHRVVPSPSDHHAIIWKLRLFSSEATKPRKIPNRALANDLMETLLYSKDATDAKTFLEKLSTLRKRNIQVIMKTIRPKQQKNMELFDKLLRIQDPKLIAETINEHWTGIWLQTEIQRYSRYSGAAYKQLKAILKYHMFQKRDGGIISSIFKEDGTITDKQDEIENLLFQTMEEIQVDHQWGWLERKEFPKLKRINQEDMEDILRTLSRNKAIAYDAASDILFEDYASYDKEEGTTNLQKTAKKLRNI